MDSRYGSAGYTSGNSVLDCLGPDDRERLLPALSVRFEDETNVLHSRDQPIETIFFPLSAVYSVIVELAQGQAYEVDVIGREGAVGAEIAIGAHHASRTVLCQGSGYVAEVPSVQVRAALDRSPAFLVAVRQSLRHQWFDSQQTVACNFAHPVEQRAARWILMMRDQVGQENFSMRPEYLSIMLGVSEVQIYEPLGLLAELGCIRYEADQLTVLSREALHDFACECYDRQRSAVLDGVR